MRQKDEEIPKMQNWAKLTQTQSKFLSPLSFIIQKKTKKEKPKKIPGTCAARACSFPPYSSYSLSSRALIDQKLDPICFTIFVLSLPLRTQLSISLSIPIFGPSLYCTHHHPHLPHRIPCSTPARCLSRPSTALTNGWLRCRGSSIKSKVAVQSQY